MTDFYPSTRERLLNLFANDVHVDYLQVLKGFGIPEENYEEMFHYLQRMKDFCGLKDITLFVAVIPAKEQFDQYHELSFFNDRIKTWCRKERIQYLDPRDYFASVSLDNIYFSWDPHLSPHGHEVYANYLYEHITSCFN